MNILEELMREHGDETGNQFPENPQINKEEMRTIYEDGGFQNHCFAEIAYFDNELCVDMYVWSLLFPNQYKRFVLSPKATMTLNERILFDMYCRDKAMNVEQEKIQKIFTVYDSYEPGLHLCPYSSPMHMFHHIYCAMHTGTEEILYKAKLGYLALYLEEMENCNLIGTSPSGIFDGLPTKLLRLFNSEFGKEVLKTTKSRTLLYELYMKRQSLFRRQWSYGQCKYFLEIICKREEEGFVEEDYWILCYLAENRSEEAHADYIEYLEKRKRLYHIVKLPLWPMEDEDRDFVKAEYLEKIFCEKGDLMKGFYSEQGEEGKKLEYADENYAVIWPKTLVDLYLESQNQRNCLWNLLEEAAYGESYFLFMRRVGDLKDSYITIEIRDGELYQALGKFNRKLTEKETDWLVNYAEIKNLGVNGEVREDVLPF